MATIASHNEKRGHARVKIVARVHMRTGGEVQLMRVGDASLTGLFLHGHPLAFPELQYGAELDLALFPEGDNQGIAFRGRVIRVDDGRYTSRPGFGVLIVGIKSADAMRYRQLLDQA